MTINAFFFAATPTPFAQLPRPAQKALIQYFGLEASDRYAAALEDAPISQIDGGSSAPVMISEGMWDDAIARVSDYDTTMYLYADVDTTLLCDAIWQINDEIRNEHADFNAYHTDYVQNGAATPVYPETDRYPVIAGCSVEGLFDGWHRFHSYVRGAHATIPAIKIATGKTR